MFGKEFQRFVSHPSVNLGPLNVSESLAMALREISAPVICSPHSLFLTDSTGNRRLRIAHAKNRTLRRLKNVFRLESDHGGGLQFFQKLVDRIGIKKRGPLGFIGGAAVRLRRFKPIAVCHFGPSFCRWTRISTPRNTSSKERRTGWGERRGPPHSSMPLVCSTYFLPPLRAASLSSFSFTSKMSWPTSMS